MWLKKSFVKRLSDIVATLAGLILLAPLLMLVTLLGRILHGALIFFRRKATV